MPASPFEAFSLCCPSIYWLTFFQLIRRMDYLQATSLILPFLWVLGAAVVDGEMIFRIDPLGKHSLNKYLIIILNFKPLDKNKFKLL